MIDDLQIGIGLAAIADAAIERFAHKWETCVLPAMEERILATVSSELRTFLSQFDALGADGEISRKKNAVSKKNKQNKLCLQCSSNASTPSVAREETGFKAETSTPMEQESKAPPQDDTFPTEHAVKPALSRARSCSSLDIAASHRVRV